MLYFVLHLALFLHGFTSSDAISAPAQSSQRNLSGSETALVGPKHSKSNRTLQAFDKEDDEEEERTMSDVLEPLLDSAEKSIEEIEKTPAVGKGIISNLMWFAESTTLSMKKLRERCRLEYVYEEQKEVLASQPVVERYDKLMLLGHSPLLMKSVFDAYGTEATTGLPLSKEISEKEQLDHLNQLITHFQVAIGHGDKGSAVLPTWQKTFESWTGRLKKKAIKRGNRDNLYISPDLTVEEGFKMGINPITYLRILINDGDIEAPKEGAVIKDLIKDVATIKPAKGVNSKGIYISKTKDEIDESRKRLEGFRLYLKAFEMDLLARKHEVEKATVASVEPAKVGSSLETR